MANLIIKPSSCGDLVIKSSDDSPAITVGTTGQATFAENATMSGATTLANATITAGTFPQGHVLQVKSLPYNSEQTTGSQAYVAMASGFKLGITPASATNKVLALVHLSGCLINGTDAIAHYTLYRSGGASGDGNLAIGGLTNASTSNDSFGVYRAAHDQQGVTNIAFNYLDSPGVDTEVFYQPYFGSDDTNTIYEQVWGHTSTITLMEIKHD